MNEKVRDLEHLEEIFAVDMKWDDDIIIIFDVDTEFDEDTNIFDGLVILRKYDSKADIGCAEHDQVWASCDLEGVIAAGLTVDDAMLLRKKGWILDEGFSHYV